jgi:Fe-S cluster assembly scaffold protein SufB
MGQLDPEPLFYLASRGFSHQECISIVLAGFAEEVLDQMSDPVLQKSLLADAIQFLRA